MCCMCFSLESLLLKEVEQEVELQGVRIKENTANGEDVSTEDRIHISRSLFPTLLIQIGIV